MMSYKLFCFDLDDTLVQTFSHVRDCLYPSLAASMGLVPPDPQAIRESWGRPLQDTLLHLFPDAPNPDKVLATLRDLHMASPPLPWKRAEEILNILQYHNRAVVIFSNGDQEIIHSTLRNSLKIDPEKLNAVISLPAVGLHKGGKGTLETIRKNIKLKSGGFVSASQTLVVGDTIHDWELAMEDGADCALLTTGVHSVASFQSVGIPQDIIFPDLSSALSARNDHGVVAIIRNREGHFLLIQEGRPNHPHFGAWSGPHGCCQSEDVLEEESVVRETREECGVEVLPLRKLYERTADTKVKTVAFWEVELRNPQDKPYIASSREVAAIRWFSLDEIRRDHLPLYPGTQDFFDHFEKLINHQL